MWKFYAVMYVAMMTVLVLSIMGVRYRVSLDRIAFPVGIGLLALSLLTFLLDVFRTLYLFQKDRKTPNPPNLNAKSK